MVFRRRTCVDLRRPVHRILRRADRFQQGDSYRIIFVHVPAAWMSMFLYVVMAIWAGLGLGLNARPSL